MQQLLRFLLRPLLIWIGNRFSSAPEKKSVYRSLSRLYRYIESGNHQKGLLIETRADAAQYIIFSDQHKGNKTAADDFAGCEEVYIAALAHYHQECFTLVNLGDAEELWKFNPSEVVGNNKPSLVAESQFQPDGKYVRCFGNHDLFWKDDDDVYDYLNTYFSMPLHVYEGVIIKATYPDHSPINIFLTHGHQGDAMSDNNSFSTWLVAHIWMPMQRFLNININSPAKDYDLRDKHNQMMYEWSSRQKDLLLITGHTHKPVFASGKYSTKPKYRIRVQTPEDALEPTYFNTGCCCFNDGDITGIEIDRGIIRLIKWQMNEGTAQRKVLEERSLKELFV